MLPASCVQPNRESLSFGAEAPRVIDLDACMLDEAFHDLVHLTEAGKARLTRRLIEELNRR
jgi:hypothetical protein